MLRLGIAFALTLTLVPAPRPRSPMADAARAWLDTLTPEQRKQAVQPYTAEARSAWMYVPGDRPGVGWRDMTAPQKAAGMALLRASLSKVGLSKVEAIRQLEAVLREVETNPGRDTERYWFVFFGEPSDDHPWTWRYEGHHVSLTFGSQSGALVSSTPQFLGSNPAEVKAGPAKGTRVLAKEQDLAFKLVDSLTPAQLATAQLSQTAPNDIVTGNARKAAIEGHKGLAYHDLTAEQRTALLQLIKVHAEVQSEPEQKRRLAVIEKDGLDALVFAWMGPVRRDARHYYRIQGKSFLIEYDNTQDDGNHIHTVWRDFKGDFGPDALAEHYAHHHHSHR